MLTIFVLDQTADARTRIIDRISELIEADADALMLLPRLNIRPITKQELKFNSAPDVLIIGDEITSSEMGEIAAIRKLLPSAAFLVKLNTAIDTLSNIEQLARLGVDDVFSDATPASEFVRKIVLLGRKAATSRSASLILIESAKGGIGVTSVAAALGEIISNRHRKVALVDLDFDTQDLSRFLQVRPFLNENLELLLKQQRPQSEESVRQCLIPVWEDDQHLVCMPPPGDSDAAFDPRSSYTRGLLSVLEYLDAMFDCVIVDCGSARGPLLRSLYRVADKIVFLASNDPACLYTSVDKIRMIKSHSSVNSEIVLVENCGQRHSLPSAVLKEEMAKAARLDPDAWLKVSIPFSAAAGHWPASGRTLATCGPKMIEGVVQSLAVRLEMIDGAPKASPPYITAAEGLRRVFEKARLFLSESKRTGKSAQPALNSAEPQAALPAPDDLVSKPTTTASTPVKGAGDRVDLLAPNARYRDRDEVREREATTVADNLVSQARVGNGADSYFR